MENYHNKYIVMASLGFWGCVLGFCGNAGSAENPRENAVGRAVSLEAAGSPQKKNTSKRGDRFSDAYKVGAYIADHTVAKERVLRRIPKSAIEAAKKKLVILFNGTSHTTQILNGMKGLEQYKPGDKKLFEVAINRENPPSGLEIRHNYIPGDDLSNDAVDAKGHTEYFRSTVAYLDAHREVNVVLWGWCDSYGHDVKIYLDNFKELISMYRAGGTKGRTRADKVDFVFMSGRASGDEADKPSFKRSPFNIANAIRSFCKKHGYFMIDYWRQDVFSYDDSRYKPTENGDRNIQHYNYVQSHKVGRDWFLCRNFVTGKVELPAHTDADPKYAQHLTGNIRAYAAWWVWARLAGWDGTLIE